MSANYLGSRTIGECIPSALTAKAALDIAIGISLPELSARLAGAIEASIRIGITPPTLALNLQIALALVAALEAGIALGLPGIDFQLDALLKLIAEIELQLGSLTAQASFSLGLGIALGQAGIHAYAVDGKVNAVGSELSGALLTNPPGAPTDHASGVLLIASEPAAAAALRTFLGLP